MYILYRLVALLAFAASVLGCDHPQRSISQRVTANGVDLIDSQVDIVASRATFDCRASRSGSCHYTLFARICQGRDACRETPLEQLAVAAGTAQDVTGLPATVQVCVRTDTASVDARCQPHAPAS